MRTLGLAEYARQHQISTRDAVRKLRRGHLPPHVGKVVNGPIGVEEWARRNGVCKPTARALYRAGKLEGVVSGVKPRARDPWWASPRAQAAMFRQLQTNARVLTGLREDLAALVREIKKAKVHIDAVTGLRARIGGFSRRLKGLGEAHARQTIKLCKFNALVKRSQVLLSEREIDRVRKHLNANPGRALAQKRWANRSGRQLRQMVENSAAVVSSEVAVSAATHGLNGDTSMMEEL